jgi:mannose-6-phosphate isomerase-like protein (cupin superfamily)
MEPEPLQLTDIDQLTNGIDFYNNIPLSIVNDHNVRLGVMVEPFYWHYHPNSDETFFGIEGVLLIDLEDRTIELNPGQLFTIPLNVIHRTRPKADRSVNLTFELSAIETIKVDIK